MIIQHLPVLTAQLILTVQQTFASKVILRPSTYYCLLLPLSYQATISKSYFTVEYALEIFRLSICATQLRIKLLNMTTTTTTSSLCPQTENGPLRFMSESPSSQKVSAFRQSVLHGQRLPDRRRRLSRGLHEKQKVMETK